MQLHQESSVVLCIGMMVKRSGFHDLHVLSGLFPLMTNHKSCCPHLPLPSIPKSRCTRVGRVKPKYIHSSGRMVLRP